MSVNANIGHNFEAAVNDLKDKQGRVNLNNNIIDEYLNRRLDKVTDKYLPNHFKDSEIVGLRSYINRDGNIVWRFYWTPRGKSETSISIGRYNNDNGRRFITTYLARKVARVLKSTKVLENNPEYIVKRELKKHNKLEPKLEKTFASVGLEFETKRLVSVKYSRKQKENITSHIRGYIKQKPISNGISKLINSNRKIFDVLKNSLPTIDKDQWVAIHTSVTNARGKFAANRLIETFRLINNYAVEKKYITKHDCHFTGDDMNKEYKRINTTPIFDEVEQERIDESLAKFESKNDSAFVSCNAISLASRLPRRIHKEVYNLRWDQISTDLGSIYYEETKTEDQSCPVWDKAIPILKKMQKWNREKFKGIGIRSEYVFPSMLFGRLLKFKKSVKKSKTPHLQRTDKTWRKILSDAKVKYRCQYMLRHSFAVKLYEATGDIVLVQNLLGHDAVETTLIYMKASKKVFRKKLNVIPRNFLSEIAAA